MNAIALLKADHRSVEELFEKLSELNGKPARNKKSIVDKIIRELSVHTAIEEQVFYPTVRREIPEEGEMVLESLEEHNIMTWELDALSKMDVDHERLDAKIKVLKDTALRHFEEEENGLFPKVREAMDNARLNELGNELEKARKVAPTRPQPHATDELPKMMNMGAADRARETGRATRGARATARGGAKRAAKSASKRATAGKRAAGGRRARSGSRAQAR